MSVTYKFRSGFQPRGVSAEVAAAELSRIHADHGAIVPAVVVDEARPASAPLHPVFEWDDRTAAEAFREHQARNLVRAVRVQYADREAQVYAHVRVLPQYLPKVGDITPDEIDESDAPTSTGGYLPVREIAKDERLVRQAIGAMVGYLKAAQRSCDDLAEAIGDAGANARGWKKRIGKILEEAAGVAA